MLERQLLGQLIGRRLLLEQIDETARSAANRLPPPLLGDQVQKLVAGDGEEPGAKAGPFGVGLPASHRLNHCQQNVLYQLPGVRLLEAAAAGKAIHERLVDRDELAPGLGIFRARQSQNQAGTSLGNARHKASVFIYTRTTKANLSALLAAFRQLRSGAANAMGGSS